MNLPDEFIEKYTKLLGDEAEFFFESFDTEPQKGFRLNPLKSNYQNVALNLEHPVDYSAVGYVGSVSGNSLEHQTGYVYSQALDRRLHRRTLRSSPDCRHIRFDAQASCR